MNTELIIIQEYCRQSRIEPDFVIQLESEGLIEITVIEGESYINTSQLRSLEQYASWYYDLSVNVEGIDIIKNLLDRMDDMQSEISRLKEMLRLVN